MDISIKDKGNVLIVRMSGELDISSVPGFKEKVVKKTENDSINYLILNLGGVSFIDSSGLGAILGRYRYLKKKGGKILLVNLTKQVKKIFTMAGMLKIMDHFVNEKGALDSITEGRIA
ncbi:MAG: STAS domain-containing protein [Halanaerobiaceae bacterium]